MDAWSELSDQQLVVAARSRHPEAYGELVQRYQATLYRLLLRLTNEQQEALDLAQEAFVRAYQALASFDTTRPFGPWLGRIATNLALNRLQQRRVPTVPLLQDGADGTPQAYSLPDYSAEPERLYLAGERQAALSQAIAALPARYRAVIELRHGQELSYEAIGATLGISLSDVKSDLFRARRMLRTALEGKHL